MQLSMKSLKFSMLIFLTLSACGQTPNGDKVSSPTNTALKDTTTIFKNISAEFCSCTYARMKNNKPSTSMDSCYRIVLLKYTDSLKGLGFDPTTQVGELKLYNEVIGKSFSNCEDLYTLIQKEIDDENAKKLLFKGELLSQTKLASGLYEIIMKDSKTSETKKFFAKNPLDDTQFKKYEPGYELTIEYEVVKNKATNKDEYYLKGSGTVSTVGAIKVVTQ